MGLGPQYVILGQQINVETLLIFMGGVNKLIDLILEASFGIIASLFLTWWVNGTEKAGVLLLDFDLKEELLSLFVALGNFVRRVHSPKGTATGWRRILWY